MAEIFPAILCENFQDFKQTIQKMEGVFEHAQVDIMDGIFVASRSFSEREEINELKLKIKIELHLMVADPVAEMRRWQTVENVTRVLFHIETKDPLRSISFARKEGWEVGVVVNPDTPLSTLADIAERVDVVQFMTVHPGKYGAPFVAEVKEKIKTFAQNPKHPLIAVDGGVSEENVKELSDLGVNIFNVGSRLTKAEDVREALDRLNSALTK